MDLKTKIKESKIIGYYYRFQSYSDIGWGEIEWWDASLIKLMAYIFLLEKIGIFIVGMTVAYILIIAFVVFFLFGIFLKRSGIYDKSVYVDAEIDPYAKELLEAARLIIKHYNKDEQSRIT